MRLDGYSFITQIMKNKQQDPRWSQKKYTNFIGGKLSKEQSLSNDEVSVRSNTLKVTTKKALIRKYRQDGMAVDKFELDNRKQREDMIKKLIKKGDLQTSSIDKILSTTRNTNKYRMAR